MANSAHLLSGRHAAVLPRTAATTTRPVSDATRFRPAAGAEPYTPADRLWCEHGWGLGGGAVAAVVGLVLAASGIAHLLG